MFDSPGFSSGSWDFFFREWIYVLNLRTGSRSRFVHVVDLGLALGPILIIFKICHFFLDGLKCMSWWVDGWGRDKSLKIK